MRFLISLLVIIFGLLYTLNEQLATFESPRVSTVPPVNAPISQPINLPRPTPLPVTTVAVSDDRIGQMITFARTWLGVPYSWGGCSKSGVDCSCFVRNVLATLGINAPRVTTQQIQWASPIGQADALAGDLVFFDNTCTGCGPNPTHVGMVLGNGMMIDAGDPVRVEPIYGGHNARYGRPPGL